MESISERILKWAEYMDSNFDIICENDIYYINDIPCCKNKKEEEFVQNTLIKHGAIPLQNMNIGETYIGFCRNSSEAIWQGDHFIYQRTKFGITFPEKINHFQNDNGFDVFVPIKIK